MNEFYNHHPGRPEPHPHGRPEPHPEYRPTPPFYDHPEPGYCIPPIPPCKPYVPGFSPEEQMGILTGKVNEMIDLFNRSQMDMWGAYHTIVESALTNDAYYNEITVEEGYIAEAGAPYKVVHIPFLDRAKQPIYLELGLAYNNTTNANVHEDVFSASERVLADKLIPAYQSTNTWYGAVVWKGAPISNIGENPAPYTVGITDHGFIKIYENLMNYTQLKQDNVRNAMLANCVLVQGGAMTPDKFEPDEKGQMLGRVGIGMNYDTKERFMVIVNGSDQSGCTAEMLANIFLKYNCTVAVEVANGMKTVGVDKGALMFTPPTVAGDEVPTIPEVNAFWYITKRRHYKNEYVKDVASLTQKYGQMLWRCETANISVDNVKETVAELSQKLDTEISDREEADAHLQEQITQEVADREEGDTTLNERITQEVQTINERIDTEVQTLNELIEATKTELQNNIDTLEAKVEQYHTELNNKDIKEVELIQDQTKDTYRIKLNDGTAVDIPMEVYNYELLVQKLAQLSNLETVLENEKTAREEADAALGKRIDDLTQSTNTNVDTLNQAIAAETLARQQADSAESTARQEADNALGQRIDELTADIGADYVEKAGSTMTGELVLFGNPTQNLGASPKQYVDTIVAQAVDAEAQERQKQNNLLSDQIAQEVTDRTQADTALDERISGVESAMTQFDNKVIVVGDTTLISEGVSAIGDGKLVLWVRENKAAVVLSAYDADAVMFKGYTMEQPAFVTYTYANTGVAFSTGAEAFLNPVVGEPSDVNQAVSKGYTDTAIDELSSQLNDLYLPKTGGAMTGALELAGDPTESLEAATKRYVDEHAGGGGDFKADGSVPASGDFNMNGHSITGLEAPVNTTDAVNMQWAKEEISAAVTDVQNQFEQAQNVVILQPTNTLQDIIDNKDKVIYISRDPLQSPAQIGLVNDESGSPMGIAYSSVSASGSVQGISAFSVHSNIGNLTGLSPTTPINDLFTIEGHYSDTKVSAITTLDTLYQKQSIDFKGIYSLTNQTDNVVSINSFRGAVNQTENSDNISNSTIQIISAKDNTNHKALNYIVFDNKSSNKDRRMSDILPHDLYDMSLAKLCIVIDDVDTSILSGYDPVIRYPIKPIEFTEDNLTLYSGASVNSFELFSQFRRYTGNIGLTCENEVASGNTIFKMKAMTINGAWLFWDDTDSKMIYGDCVVNGNDTDVIIKDTIPAGHYIKGSLISGTAT